MIQNSNPDVRGDDSTPTLKPHVPRVPSRGAAAGDPGATSAAGEVPPAAEPATISTTADPFAGPE